MAKGFISGAGYKAYLGATKLKAGYIGATRVYSAGSTVTYVVDSGIAYTEEVDSGVSCLTPRTFVPSKAGWTFLGWRSDGAAVADVYSSLAMGDSPVTLYAVFYQTITVTYYNGTTYPNNSQSGNRYYNNGAVTNPTFVGYQADLAGWTARGWSTDPAGNGGIVYANGVAYARDSSIVLYGMYQQIITLSYNGNGATGGYNGDQTGVRYYNSNGNVVNPSFALQANAFTRAGFNFAYWALNGGTAYNPGAVITLDASAVMYAAWTATAYYAIQNGVANSAVGIANPVITKRTTRQGKYNEGPEIQSAYNILGIVASVQCSASDDGPIFEATTGWIPTNGLAHTHIDLAIYTYFTHGGVSTPYDKVYGLTPAGAQILIGSGYCGTPGYADGSRDYDVSQYTHIAIYMGANTSGGSSGLNKKFLVGVKNLRFY